jgi:hypothetical protein
MRANRTYGSEGGESQTLPDPYHVLKRKQFKDVDGRDTPETKCPGAAMTMRRVTTADSLPYTRPSTHDPLSALMPRSAGG